MKYTSYKNKHFTSFFSIYLIFKSIFQKFLMLNFKKILFYVFSKIINTYCKTSIFRQRVITQYTSWISEY